MYIWKTNLKNFLKTEMSGFQSIKKSLLNGKYNLIIIINLVLLEDWWSEPFYNWILSSGCENHSLKHYCSSLGVKVVKSQEERDLGSLTESESPEPNAENVHSVTGNMENRISIYMGIVDRKWETKRVLSCFRNWGNKWTIKMALACPTIRALGVRGCRHCVRAQNRTRDSQHSPSLTSGIWKPKCLISFSY